mmetsp:Transcript_174682/g.424994  ORF Transcript_174682/g.424994 Transcript_174682/m.424994 type:complete len:214 (-) Transcript_174682:162-803(-)
MPSCTARKHARHDPPPAAAPWCQQVAGACVPLPRWTDHAAAKALPGRLGLQLLHSGCQAACRCLPYACERPAELPPRSLQRMGQTSDYRRTCLSRRSSSWTSLSLESPPLARCCPRLRWPAPQLPRLHPTPGRHGWRAASRSPTRQPASCPSARRPPRGRACARRSPARGPRPGTSSPAAATLLPRRWARAAAGAAASPAARAAVRRSRPPSR